MNRTEIAWTDRSWNPVRGCSRVSAGCVRCYAERMAARFSDPGMWGHGFAKMTKAGPRWTGRVELVPEKLDEPLRLREPQRIFVNSTSDLFHEALPDEAIDRVFAVMALAQEQTFQILTKRPARMLDYARRLADRDVEVGLAIERVPGDYGPCAVGTIEDLIGSGPLPNVWLGSSVENRATLHRIADLRETPGAVRWVSFEPLLEDLGEVDLRGIDWAVIGGESGPGARYCDVGWIAHLTAQCRAAGTKVWIKQAGGPRPGQQGAIPDDLWHRKELPR